MNYDKFHKLIEEQNPEQKEEFYLKLKEKLNIPDEEQKVEEKKGSGFVAFFKKPYRVIACASAVLVIICLSVFIPFALKNKTPAERYCIAGECIETKIQSIKEFSKDNSLNILYYNWYDTGEVISSKLFMDAKDNDKFVYITEEIVNGVTGDFVKLSITDIHTKVDIFEKYWNNCDKECLSKNIKVYWKAQNTSSMAYFEYDGYRYFVELDHPESEEAILDIVAEMLP